MPRSALPYFDVNRPIPGGIETIQGLLGQYASPQAADADFSPASGGRAFLTKEYQRLSGDAFADPFQDNERASRKPAIDAALAGASLAVGGNNGPRMLTPPRMMEAGVGVDTAGGKEGAERLVPALRGMDRIAALQSFLPKKDILDSDKYSLDYATDQADLIRRRHDRVGFLHDPAANEISWNLRNSKFQPEINSTLLQEGATGEDSKRAKIHAAGQIDPALLEDKMFMHMWNTDKPRAARFYKAHYGRELSSDAQSYLAQHEAERKSQLENQGRLLDEIKDPVYDDDTGVLMNRVYVKDPANPLAPAKPEFRPVSAFQRQAIDAQGGTIRRWGIPARQRKLPPGVTDAKEAHQFTTVMDGLLDKGVPPKEAFKQANNILARSQMADSVSPAASRRDISGIYEGYRNNSIPKAQALAQLAEISNPDAPLDQRNWGVRTGDALGTTAAQGINFGLDFTNDTLVRRGWMQANRTIPQIPIPRGGFRSE